MLSKRLILLVLLVTLAAAATASPVHAAPGGSDFALATASAGAAGSAGISPILLWWKLLSRLVLQDGSTNPGMRPVAPSPHNAALAKEGPSVGLMRQEGRPGTRDRGPSLHIGRLSTRGEVIAKAGPCADPDGRD